MRETEKIKENKITQKDIKKLLSPGKRIILYGKKKIKVSNNHVFKIRNHMEKYIGQDAIKSSIDARNVELDNKYNVKFEHFNNINNYVQKSTELSDDEKLEYQKSTDSKLDKIELKTIKLMNKGLGVFSLSKMFLSKLKENCQLRKEKKVMEKLEIKAAKMEHKQIEKDINEWKKLNEEKAEADRVALIRNQRLEELKNSSEAIKKIIEIQKHETIYNHDFDEKKNFSKVVNPDEVIQKKKEIFELEKKIDELLQHKQGKKVYIPFNGSHIEYPKKYAGQLRAVDGKRKKLKKELDILTKEEVVVSKPLEVEPIKKEVKEVKKAKTNMKKKVAMFAVGVGILIGFGAMFQGSGNLKNVNNNPIQTSEVAIESSIDNDVEIEKPINSNGNFDYSYDFDKPIVDINDTFISENTSINIVDNINLGDSIDLKNGCKIYKDSYSMTNKENGFDRYFSNSANREVSAVVYSLNGECKTIFASNPDCLENINTLKSMGAKVSGVLINNVEGFISIDDVEKINEMGHVR